TCTPVGAVQVPVAPATAFDRSHGSFPFAPAIAGIQPGHFDGTVRLKNGAALSDPQDVAYDVVTPAVFDVAPSRASLGQFVAIDGGGFVGPADAGDTTSYTVLALDGSFSYDDDPTEYPVAIDLVPEFVSGPLVRYVVNEDDALGKSLDLRKR